MIGCCYFVFALLGVVAERAADEQQEGLPAGAACS